MSKATFAAGCFWGVEHYFKKQFLGKGVLSSACGYTGGGTENPTYRQVCSGATGHAEAVELTFDPQLVSYESLVEFFFRLHDPTTLDRQGNDRGTQYRSAIFYHNEEQRNIAEQVKSRIQQQHYPNQPIVTQIVPSKIFYRAEEDHQNYLELNPGGYCNHRLRW